MKNIIFLVLAILTLALGACKPVNPALAREAPVPEISQGKSPVSDASGCTVTSQPKNAFQPPSPWPAEPPGETDYWYGTPGLWTALPSSGSWAQLEKGEKFWFWSEEFDVKEDTTPDLVVSANRLDGKSEGFSVADATNGFHESFNWAMLTGVELPSPGCWEFTALYKGYELNFTILVPEK